MGQIASTVYNKFSLNLGMGGGVVFPDASGTTLFNTNTDENDLFKSPTAISRI